MNRQTLRTAAGIGSISALALVMVACGGSSSSAPQQPANQAPSKPLISTGPTTAITKHEYIYNLTSTDPEGDAITFSLSPANTEATITGNTLKYRPNVATAQTVTLSVLATDSKGAASTPGTVAVNVLLNRAPVFSSPTSFSLTGSGAAIPPAFNYAASAVDPDGDTVTYSPAGHGDGGGQRRRRGGGHHGDGERDDGHHDLHGRGACGQDLGDDHLHGARDGHGGLGLHRRLLGPRGDGDVLLGQPRAGDRGFVDPRGAAEPRDPGSGLPVHRDGREPRRHAGLVGAFGPADGLRADGGGQADVDDELRVGRGLRRAAGDGARDGQRRSFGHADVHDQRDPGHQAELRDADVHGNRGRRAVLRSEPGAPAGDEPSALHAPRQ
ncbi:MAG: hypothetical protein IPL96_12935 [Holophagaceae bacterium]|nr:hypothetical protein [Holophagaceae bacterium]